MTVGTGLERGEVPREDVAATVLAVLETPSTVGKAFELVSGRYADRRGDPRAVNEQRAAEVLRRVRSVPEGRVTTYGDLTPGAPRFAGAVLSATDEDVPWQRIVRADGSLAKGERQRRLLVAEGVPFRGERVDMREAWVPVSASGR